ncbi:DSD1 family PLP-dependent enzyme [Mesorhizobium sp. CGMCC 1.15528]|uniref:DSD1 family PLP-dependent enzyme n=1 Tax=Mesorhizobium zhangyense TaxID=1776730 RepID=A0A7C9RBL8_9HYPH|nr:DSD1 family PLP-dependent enzyme [Mesorhizobium zhangyense]NGN44478.1 DSD1 family PLP-dependent enzyme [Mesorhizobium zhangyense]
MDLETLEVGYDIPARPGQRVVEVLTPALIIDLDRFERNLGRMRNFIARHGLRLRAHAKTHKSADIALRQIVEGGACGICCQKVSEAEAFVRAGITDILVSNEVRGDARADRLAWLAAKARIIVCVDDIRSVGELSLAAQRHGSTLEVLVEIDCGAHRCGVAPGAAAVDLACAVNEAPALRFEGLQAYQGSLQHIEAPVERRRNAETAAQATRTTVEMLAAAGMECRTVGGAGTGSFAMDAELGVINELQCGSYIFMDAHYDRVKEDGGGKPGGMENALFVMAGVMSTAIPGRPVCDAGLKALAVDSGLPRVDRAEIRYVRATDEHGVLDDPERVLDVGDRLLLVPGHCDPTCNLHDWYVAVRGERVEAIWPVTARGKLF